MTNDLTQRDICLLSIDRVLDVRKASGAEPVTPHWLRDALRRVADRVPATCEYEPLCLNDVRIADSGRTWGEQYLCTRWLMQRGWDVASSLLAWRNFRTAFPVMQYAPEALRLLHRDQLIAEYGVTFGNLLANLCIDEDSQPIFNALLHNRFDVEVHRPSAFVELVVNYPADQADMMKYELPNFLIRYFQGLGATSQDKPVTIDDALAKQIYHKATGRELQTYVSLHPIELDYGNP